MHSPANLIDPNRIASLLDTLIRIPSITNHEHAIADWVHAWMMKTGLVDLKRLPVSESGDTLIGWLDGPIDGPAMCLNFHLDTFGVFNGWVTDPFEPVIIGRRLHALGAHDMKAGGACILAALEVMQQAKVKLKGRVLLACTTDEENWSRGAHALIASGALKQCIGALVPEPTPHGMLRVGARGRHVITIHLKGRSAHVAFDDTAAINSAHDAARIIQVLADREGLGLKFDQTHNMRSGLGVIGVHAGGTMILVPEEAKIIVDRHLLPGETLATALEHLEAMIKRAGIQGEHHLTWDDRPTPAPGAFVVPADAEFTRIARAAWEEAIGLSVALTIARSVADVNHIAVHGAVPTLTAGPWGGNTCEANEWVDLDSLLPCARMHVNTVMRMLSA